MNGGALINREALIELLKATIEELERNASFEGRIQYTCMPEVCEKDQFVVAAFVRTGNDMGQGGSMMIDGDVSLEWGPPPGDPVQSIREQVLAFHEKFGQAIGEKPHVPDAETIKFRLSLIAEEFFELLEAAGLRGGAAHDRVREYIKDSLKLNDQFDMLAFVDAMADLDYVVEGTRITMGVNGVPIAAEVQRANMDKIPAVTGDRYDGTGAEMPRPTKPPGWRGPDIEGELKRQGWDPTSTGAPYR